MNTGGHRGKPVYVYVSPFIYKYAASETQLHDDPKSDQGMTTSSAGSMTPRSPLLTSHIGLLLVGKGAFSEYDDLPQMNELADIARCVANTPLDDDRSTPYLLSYLDDLRDVVDRRKFEALTVATFGARIEKLIREKYLQLWEIEKD